MPFSKSPGMGATAYLFSAVLSQNGMDTAWLVFLDLSSLTVHQNTYRLHYLGLANASPTISSRNTVSQDRLPCWTSVNLSKDIEPSLLQICDAPRLRGFYASSVCGDSMPFVCGDSMPHSCAGILCLPVCCTGVGNALQCCGAAGKARPTGGAPTQPAGREGNALDQWAAILAPLQVHWRPTP